MPISTTRTSPHTTAWLVLHIVGYYPGAGQLDLKLLFAPEVRGGAILEWVGMRPGRGSTGGTGGQADEATFAPGVDPLNLDGKGKGGVQRPHGGRVGSGEAKQA